MNNPFSRTANAASTAPSPSTTRPTDSDDVTHELDLAHEAPRRSRRRTIPLIAGLATLAILGSGAAIASAAHKTITLDVDGHITEVTTWSGSVEKLLAEQAIVVGERDIVAPSPAASLSEGGEVVVRYGREVTVSDDGEVSQIWTTAVDADEVLASLAARGDDAHLVASRSSERTEIGIRLPTEGTVNLSVDGQITEVPAGPEELDAFLDSAGVVLQDLDRVFVKRLDAEGNPAADGTVTVVVNRVVVEEQSTVTAIAHESQTVEDASRYSDLSIVTRTAGADGERTLVESVTLVDGQEESRTQVSDTVTLEPVTEVLVKGTKARPVVAKTTAPATTSGTAAAAAPADQGSAPSEGVWAQLAQCESGGNPAAVSKNGTYHGLYQFSVSTWQSVGGSGLPSQASAAEQTERAIALQARSGWGQWPHCSSKLGLR